MSDTKNRCGNCMEPHRAHRPRREAAPTCPNFKGVYREATEEELSAAYAAAFPDGPKPIATFRADNPADVERLKSIVGREALERTFGPGGGGMPAFVEAIERAGKGGA